MGAAKKSRDAEAVKKDLAEIQKSRPTTARTFDELTDLELEHMTKLLRHKSVTQREMARIVHEEWGKYLDLKRDTLSKRIQRFYNREIKAKDGILELVAGNNRELYDALNLNRAHLDVLGEFSELYVKHKHLMDKQFKAIQGVTNPDMRRWNSSLKESVSMLRLITNTYMDVGIMERKPKQSQVHVHATSDKDELTFEAGVAEQVKLEDNTKKVLDLLQNVEYSDITDQEALPAPAEASNP